MSTVDPEKRYKSTRPKRKAVCLCAYGGRWGGKVSVVESKTRYKMTRPKRKAFWLCT